MSENNNATSPLDELDEYTDDVGLGAEDKKHASSGNQEWFKGEKGKTYRAALVYFHGIELAVALAAKKKNPAVTKETLEELATKVVAKRAEELGKSPDQLSAVDKLDINNLHFRKFLAHYREGIGFYLSRLGKDGAEADEAWKMMGDQKKYFTTVLLVYPTNNEGEIIKEQLAHSWFVKPWRFGGKVYGRLHAVADSLRSNDLAIATQDLKLKCANAEYQNFDIDSAGKALWRQNDKFKAAVLEKAVALYDKLVPFREISSADLRIKLGLSTGTAGSGDVSEEDFGGLLDQV